MPKTTHTLENNNVISVVGSSVQMEQFDLGGKNVIINSNQRLQDLKKELENERKKGIIEVSE